MKEKDMRPSIGECRYCGYKIEGPYRKVQIELREHLLSKHNDIVQGNVWRAGIMAAYMIKPKDDKKEK